MATDGERCVMMILMTQQQESFATCSDTDALDGFLVIATVPVVERFGWTMFAVVDQKQALHTVHATDGAVTTVDTVKMFRFLAPE